MKHVASYMCNTSMCTFSLTAKLPQQARRVQSNLLPADVRGSGICAQEATSRETVAGSSQGEGACLNTGWG